MVYKRLKAMIALTLIRKTIPLLCVFIVIVLSLPQAFANGLPGNLGGEPPPPSSPLPDTGDPSPSCGSGGGSCEANGDVGSASQGNDPDVGTGNPINLISGKNHQSEVDFQIPGAMLSLKRMHNSGNSDSNQALGQGWQHSYPVSLFNAGQNRREIIQSNGARLMFAAQGADENGNPLFRAAKSQHGYLIYSPGNKRHYWHLGDGRTLSFNGSYLTEIDWPDQRKLKLYYRSKRLHSVTDETGRSLVFSYSGNVQADWLPGFDPTRVGTAAGYLESVTLPDGSQIGYDYDNKRNLTRVRFADGASREYHYEDETYRNHLTGLTDRAGVRYASWAYDEYGRGISSEHAGGVDRITLVYPHPNEVATRDVVQTIVTNSLGYESQYSWQHPRGESYPRLLESSGAGCATCPMTGMAYEYDEQGRLSASISTGLGSAQNTGSTRYVYDDQGRISEIRLSDANGIEQLFERYEYNDNELKSIRTYCPSINPDAERVTQVDLNEQQPPRRILERGYRPDLSSTTDLSNPSIEVSHYTPVERITTLFRCPAIAVVKDSVFVQPDSYKITCRFSLLSGRVFLIGSLSMPHLCIAAIQCQ